MMWRCLSDLGGQSDLWADVDARTTRGVSVGARVGLDVPMWHICPSTQSFELAQDHTKRCPTNGSPAPCTRWSKGRCLPVPVHSVYEAIRERTRSRHACVTRSHCLAVTMSRAVLLGRERDEPPSLELVKACRVWRL